MANDERDARCPTIRNGLDLAEIAKRRAHSLLAFSKYRTEHPNARWQDYVFRDHAAERIQIIEAYRRARLPNTATSLERCSSQMHIWRHDPTGTHIAKPMLCRRRLCPNCSTWFAKPRRAEFLSNLPAPVHRLSFLTLTQRARREWGLRYSLRNILHAFRRLRRTEIWRDNVVAGAYVSEITYNREQGWYHAHLHCIIDAKYIPIDQLSAAWSAALGEKSHLDLQAADTIDRLSPYLSKYLSKPIPSELYQDGTDVLTDYIKAIHGLRLIARFGTWSRKKMSLAKSAKEKYNQSDDFAQSKWVYIGELQELITRATHGDAGAADALNKVGFGTPTPSLLDDFNAIPNVRAPPPNPQGVLRFADSHGWTTSCDAA